MRMTHTSEDRGKTSSDDNGIFAWREFCEKAFSVTINLQRPIIACHFGKKSLLVNFVEKHFLYQLTYKDIS